MKLLDESEGLSRIERFPNKVQDRYCILPFTGDNNFRENAYEDTIHWYASENYYYYFVPLPSWELILRSKLRTVFGFRNDLISTTYSEVGGILYLPISKFRTEKDFEIYCKDEFLKSSINHKQDSVISLEVKSVAIPNGFKYAKIVNIEIRNMNDDLSKDKPLLIHSTYFIFFWTNEKGKGNTACLYTSERGLPHELQATSTLEERILWSWQSLRLIENHNKK